MIESANISSIRNFSLVSFFIFLLIFIYLLFKNPKKALIKII